PSVTSGLLIVAKGVCCWMSIQLSGGNVRRANTASLSGPLLSSLRRVKLIPAGHHEYRNLVGIFCCMLDYQSDPGCRGGGVHGQRAELRLYPGLLERAGAAAGAAPADRHRGSRGRRAGGDLG